MLTVLGWTASFLFCWGLGKVKEVDVGSEPGEEMNVFSQHAVHRFPKAVVPEPGIGHDEQGELVGIKDIAEHLGGLIKFGLKFDFLLARSDPLSPESFLGVIESEVQRETSPAALDGGEQPDGDNVLSPGVRGLVLFSGMIEETVAGEDFLSDLRVDAIIECQEESSASEGCGYCFPEGFPEAEPRDFGGGHESIKPPPGNMSKPKDGVETTQKIGRFRRCEGDDDGQEGVDEPGTAFLAFSGMGKIIFELSEELV